MPYRTLITLVLIISTMTFNRAGAEETRTGEDEDWDAAWSVVETQYREHLDELNRRITTIEKSLAEVKEELRHREAQAGKLIAERVKELTKVDRVSKRFDVGPNEWTDEALLTAEGWQAWQQQDWRVAMKSFQAALDQAPDHVAALHGLGWTYFHLSQHEEALQTFRDTLALDESIYGAINGVGQCLLALDRAEEAVAWLRRSTEEMIESNSEAYVVHNGMTASWLGLIQALNKLKRREEAIDWCRRYMQHKPDDQTVKSLLQQAESTP